MPTPVSRAESQSRDVWWYNVTCRQFSIHVLIFQRQKGVFSRRQQRRHGDGERQHFLVVFGPRRAPAAAPGCLCFGILGDDHRGRGEADAGPVGRHQHALQLRLVRRRRAERQGATGAVRPLQPRQHLLHELNHPGEAFKQGFHKVGGVYKIAMVMVMTGHTV